VSSYDRHLAAELVSLAFFDLLSWPEFRKHQSKPGKRTLLENHISAIEFFNSYENTVWAEALSISPVTIKKAVFEQLSGRRKKVKKGAILSRFHLRGGRRNARKEIHV